MSEAADISDQMLERTTRIKCLLRLVFGFFKMISHFWLFEFNSDVHLVLIEFSTKSFSLNLYNSLEK